MTMNRTIALMLLGCLCLPAGPERARAADCPIGSQQTLTGTLSMVIDSSAGGWVSSLPSNVRPCSVGALRGTGRIPGGCEFGKRFTATGSIRDAFELELAVASIRCE